MSGTRASGRTFEHRLGRLLIVVTYVAVGLLAIGVALLLLAGVSPLAGGPPNRSHAISLHDSSFRTCSIWSRPVSCGSESSS